MKIIKIVPIIAVLAFPAISFASGPTNIDPAATMSIGSQMIRPSNNVGISVTSNQYAFACASGHTKGDRIFGSSSADNKIYWKDSIGTPITSGANGTIATTVGNTSQIDFAGNTAWSAM